MTLVLKFPGQYSTFKLTALILHANPPHDICTYVASVCMSVRENVDDNILNILTNGTGREDENCLDTLPADIFL